MFYRTTYQVCVGSKKEEFLNQPKIKNLFYELDDSTFRPDLNLWSMVIVILNGLALLIIATILVMSFL